MGEATSIGFGNGEVIEFGAPLEEVAKMAHKAMRRRAFLELDDPRGQKLYVNPIQITVLQRLPDHG